MAEIIGDAMTRYTNADFGDDDSVNSVQLTEGISTSATHIRYHPGAKLWQVRSTLERILIFLGAFLFMIVIVLSIVINVIEHHMQETKDRYTRLEEDLPCLNQSCVHAASHMMEAMALDVDPCDDFYEYSCRKWVKANPVPGGKSNWGTFMKLEQQNGLIIKRVLDQPVETFKSKAEEKAKMYYDSCVDVNETIEAKGADPMLKLIDKLGGWNITRDGFKVSDKNDTIGKFNLTNWSLQRTAEIVQNKFHIGALFSYDVGEDDKNSTRHVLQVDQSGLALPSRDNYLNKTDEHLKILKAYKDYMTKVGVLLGGDLNETLEQMEAVVDFETRLANITIPDELRRDEEKFYHNMTVAELQLLAPFIDWRSFFGNALRTVNRKVGPKEPVIVYAPEYLQNLTLLIKEYQSSEAGNNTLNNYLVWQTVRSFVPYLSKVFRDAYKGLRVALYGSDGGEEPQWRYCIQDTNTVLGFAIGAIFVKEVIHQDSKAQAEEMISNVRNAFKRNFKNLDWMDEETRKVAVDKADAISDMIGYPDFVKDSAQLDNYYENLTIRADSYFDNNLNINSYNWKKNLEKINEPVNRTTWSMVPSSVNAYYTPTKNQMVFPAGILQNPFYDRSFPPSLNYGAMGVVIGHELTHGFDDEGRLYDKNGNLNRWWKNETIARFKNRTKCVVDQYSQYSIDGKNINGNRTLGENIADNGGLKAAYHAYLDLMRDKPEPQRLPGLPLSHRQLFFVAFAQVWCSTITKEVTNLEIERDSHSPPKFRVIGAVSNLREFSDAFGCKPGSKMNPRKKCEVW
ncbi:endothelin-converting enzyme homolog isoform X2 [Cylas formicarius]|uniref:endothelin-converting enzyme homolog isoform X2 n=1 Tax=Cylas formicarius TaxID=197179 RepID=UPI002958B1B8|nr:endothelin-converting enzyme homolog isoform X2 [Cylas formicarius]